MMGKEMPIGTEIPSLHNKRLKTMKKSRKKYMDAYHAKHREYHKAYMHEYNHRTRLRRKYSFPVEQLQIVKEGGI